MSIEDIVIVYYDWDIDETLNRIEDEIEMMLHITEKGWY